MDNRRSAILLAALLTGLPPVAFGQQIIQDNFTGASSAFQWQSFLGACLTAGDGTGSIPACIGLPYYGGQTLVGGNNGTLPDAAGSGALRFTNGYTAGGGGFNFGFNQAGGVISKFTYPTGQGLQVTFTTVTYRGNSGGAGKDGADGISFFLMDGSYPNYDLGAFGGSLGYTCSNANNDPKLHPDGSPRQYDGLAGGYLGLGIDEYGNFLNQGDNSATGYGYQPGRIGLRGAGTVSWLWLTTNYPALYPASLSLPKQADAVRNTCRTGKLWDYSNAAAPLQTLQATPDYAPIPNAYKILPNGFQIANEAAVTRADGIPITYKLKITSNGLLSFAYSYNGGAYQPVITGQDITAGNGPLPASLHFGFGGSTGGSTNIHELMCFQAAPADSAASSAGLNEKQTAKVQTGTQVYFAFYNPSNWSGSLTAQDLVVDPTTNLVSINPVANWDASCVLTGIAAGQNCLATGAGGPQAAEGWNARTILSWDGTSGIPFRYPKLSPAEQAAITLGDAVPNNSRVRYLRGDRSNEIDSTGAGLYRPRASVLGDIVDSSPTWVGPPMAPYGVTWLDRLNASAGAPENAGPDYPTFKSTAGQRLNVVYSGANDGLLHGFRSGSYSSSNTYVAGGSTPNDGYEVLAYAPAAVVNSIHSVVDPTIDYSNPQYGHTFFVDAAPGTGDLYYGGAWHTWLVGGLGAGGAAIYALDVTDPSTFAENSAASLVIGEWAPSTLSCSGNPTCGQNLGNTYGVPQIRRFHNGSWGAVFGNGFGSASGDAGIYVMTVDPASGAPTFYYLSTGIAGGNGIAYVTPADLDADHISDYVYAGDLLGHVWRFDVTNSDPSKWAVSAGGPLFTTPGGQPITTKLIVAATPATTGPPRIVVSFGTGQQTPLTNSSPTTYAAGTQSLYGVWDWNTTAWNAISGAQYAGLFGSYTVSVSNLQQQTVLGSVPDSSGFRSVSSNPVCWFGSMSCPSGDTQFGWYLNLPAAGEQIVYSPTLEVGAFIVNTTIPPNNNPRTCTSANPTGWTMAISPTTGGAFTKSFFGDQNGHFVNYNGQVVSGVALSGTGSVSIVTTSGQANGTFLVTQTSTGAGVVLPINPLATAKGSRLTWIERR
jgi:type IV pilus assembly protein PilY1